MKNTYGGMLLSTNFQAKFSADLVTFTEEILNGIHHFLSSVPIGQKMKTFEIQRFSNVFRGQEKRPVAWNGINCYERCGVPKVHSLKGHSMWNGPNFREVPTSPSWILLKFCRVNVPIKKWKFWKFYCLLVDDSKITAT